MAKFVDQAQGLVDRIETKMKENEAEFGSAFAPFSDAEAELLRQIPKPDAEEMEQAKNALKAIASRMETLWSDLESVLNEQQKRLYAKLPEAEKRYGAIVGELTQKQEAGNKERENRMAELMQQLQTAAELQNEEVIDRIMDEFDQLMQEARQRQLKLRKARDAARADLGSDFQQFFQSFALEPQKQSMVQELSRLTWEKHKLEDIAEGKVPLSAIAAALSEITGGMSKVIEDGEDIVRDDKIEKESLTVDFPERHEQYPAFIILRDALRTSQSGYDLAIDPNDQLHLFTAKNASPLDMAY